MQTDLDQFYLSKEEPTQGCLISLRNIILASHKAVSETRKYGMPCFCFKNKMFCYLWTDKKNNHPYLLLVEGQHLNHEGLVQGNRKRMKIFNVNPTEDIPIDSINSLLGKAIELYLDGTIKTK